LGNFLKNVSYWSKKKGKVQEGKKSLPSLPQRREKDLSSEKKVKQRVFQRISNGKQPTGFVKKE